VGSGVLVRAKRAAGGARGVGNAFGPFEIMRARQVLEGELAALAARRMNKAGVASLRDALSLMEAEISQGIMPTRGDRLFHLRVAEAAQNGPLLRAVTELYDERNNPLFEHFGHHFENGPSWSKAVAEHQTVVDAIAARDAEAARRCMQRHLQRSQDRFAQGLGDTVPASTSDKPRNNAKHALSAA
jgi:GntR family transcriptional regulator, transcriptional repressor for pyruvate dehydrogenase complex